MFVICYGFLTLGPRGPILEAGGGKEEGRDGVRISRSVLLSPPHPLSSFGGSPPGIGCGLSRRRFCCQAAAAAATGAAAGAATRS